VEIMKYIDIIISYLPVIIPPAYATYLSIKKEYSFLKKITIWIVCSIIVVCGIYNLNKKMKDYTRKDAFNNFLYYQSQRAELYNIGLPDDEIDALGETPLLKYYYEEGLSLQKKEEYNNAITSLKKALHLPIIKPQNKAILNIEIGDCYKGLNKEDLSQSSYLEAFEISDDIDDKNDRYNIKAIICIKKAWLYDKSNDLDEKLNCLIEALDWYRKNDNRKGIISTLSILGVNFIISGKYYKAEKVLREALDMQVDENHNYTKAFCQSLLAKSLYFINNTEEAKEYLVKSIQFYRKNNYTDALVGDYLTLGTIYLLDNEIKKALAYAKDAIEMCSETNNKGECYIQSVEFLTLYLYFVTGDYEKAVKIMKETFKKGGAKNGYTTFTLTVPVFDAKDETGKNSKEK
jgi:tetratricopeptide (TPR) repeat protein